MNEAVGYRVGRRTAVAPNGSPATAEPRHLLLAPSAWSIGRRLNRSVFASTPEV